MSIELVENEIRRFLSSEQPEIICLSGHWGVGKTFAWKRYLSEANTKGEIALKRYSYVSLFGIDSLDEPKYQMPRIKSYVGGLGPVWFLSGKETIRLRR